jgi:hypothetical protein
VAVNAVAAVTAAPRGTTPLATPARPTGRDIAQRRTSGSSFRHAPVASTAQTAAFSPRTWTVVPPHARPATTRAHEPRPSVPLPARTPFSLGAVAPPSAPSATAVAALALLFAFLAWPAGLTMIRLLSRPTPSRLARLVVDCPG